MPRRVLLLSCALCIGAGGADASPEGALKQFGDLEPVQTGERLGLIEQAQHELLVDLTVVQFQLTYGNRVRIERLYFPATTADREKVPGYLFTPAGGVPPGQRRAGLVMVHGGYHSSLEWPWFRLIVTAVERGYVVIFPEYRGSRGYGAEHFENNYGTTDVADTLAAAEYLGRLDFVRADSLGIFGRSRGGMITLLAIQQAPARFKAAVDVVGIADFLAYMAYKSDDRRRQVADDAHFGGQTPDRNLPAYLEVSPIQHVDKIKTPVLYLGTTGDRIVPVGLHGERLVDVMRARGKAIESHIYDRAPGGHSFMFVDCPEAQDATDRTFAFLGRHLKP